LMREKAREPGFRCAPSGLQTMLRRHQHLAAGGGKLRHSHGRLLLRWNGRRLGVQDGVAEPVIEIAAAAVVGLGRALRRAVRTVRRTVKADMEMIVVSPPWPHLAQPGTLVAGIA